MIMQLSFSLWIRENTKNTVRFNAKLFRRTNTEVHIYNMSGATVVKSKSDLCLSFLGLMSAAVTVSPKAQC